MQECSSFANASYYPCPFLFEHVSFVHKHTNRTEKFSENCLKNCFIEVLSSSEQNCFVLVHAESRIFVLAHYFCQFADGQNKSKTTMYDSQEQIEKSRKKFSTS